MPSDVVPVRRALLSVSDKTGLVELGRALVGRGATLVSTGGTHRALRDADLPVLDVADVTGSPEMMDGRVKTLHPKVHGGILAVRDDPAHVQAMKMHGIEGVDLVVVNLYPFEAALGAGAGFADQLEQIDVGGPAMIRAAAKNHAHVAVVVEPSDYGLVLRALSEHGGVPAALRRALAAKAFARTAAYDAAISDWLAHAAGEAAPGYRAIGGKLRQALRYGENPHQRAAFYAGGRPREGVATARQIGGKELSYNNIADTDSAFEAVAELGPEAPAIVIVKHANPCGAAVGASLAEAHAKALACDPVSAFGGIVAANRPLDEAAARAIAGVFTEVVIAPGADEAALAVFADKKNLRLLLTAGVPEPSEPGLAARTVAGGLLVQDRDGVRVGEADLAVVTKRAPSPAERADLLFAWRVAKHVRSNAIVYAKGGATVGIGAGQMSRVDSARIAAWKSADAAKAAGLAEPGTRGSVAASDAFFPFADGLEAVVAAGATAVIQPGGSVRDAEVIAAADAGGIAMVFTGMRHFRH